MRTLTSLSAGLLALGVLLGPAPALAQSSKSSRAAAARAAAAAAAAAAETSAQSAPKMLDYSDANKMSSYPLHVSDQKTTHLVFPFPVTYVDLGSSGLIAAKATGAENIVRVKAAQGHFSETNMTVLTSDGKLYSFVVNYDRDPAILSLNLGAMPPPPVVATTTASAAGGASAPAPAPPASNQAQAILTNSPLPQGSLDTFAQQALEHKGTVVTETQNQLTLRAGEVGYRQETLFFPLHITNKSNVSYDIDFVKFYIQDKQQAKRTAEQAIEVQPIYVYNASQKKINANVTVQQVYIFKKFTIPDQKQLVVELYEKGGGRNIKLVLSNNNLLKAHNFN